MGSGWQQPADAGESAPDALIRESREELGVTVRRENIRFAHLSHCAEATGENTCYNLYFIVTRWEETPRIMEPEKSAALRFFDVTQLPENTILLRRRDILSCPRGNFYTEYRDAHPRPGGG